MKPTLTLTFESMAELAEFVAGKAAPMVQTQPATAAPMVPTMPAAPAATQPDDEDDNGAPAADANGVDADGLPWDERIHAPSKGQNKDGTWRKKKKLDDAFVAGVEAELRQQQPATAAPTVPTMPPAPGAPATAAPTVPTMPPAPGAPSTPSAPPMPQVDQPAPEPAAPIAQPAPEPAAPIAQPAPEPAPAPAAEGIDFHTFMQQLSAQMQKRDASGQPVINADYLASATAEISGAWQVPLNAITDIASNPQMITYAVQVFQRDGKWG